MSHDTLTINDFQNASSLEDLFQFLSTIPQEKRKFIKAAIGTPDGAIPIDNFKKENNPTLEGGTYKIGQFSPDHKSYCLPFTEIAGAPNEDDDNKPEYGTMSVFVIGGDM
jgi:hypothetical protein